MGLICEETGILLIKEFRHGRRSVRIFYVRQGYLSDVKTGEGAETGKESRFKLMAS